MDTILGLSRAMEGGTRYCVAHLPPIISISAHSGLCIPSTRAGSDSDSYNHGLPLPRLSHSASQPTPAQPEALPPTLAAPLPPASQPGLTFHTFPLVLAPVSQRTRNYLFPLAPTSVLIRLHSPWPMKSQFSQFPVVFRIPAFSCTLPMPRVPALRRFPALCAHSFSMYLCCPLVPYLADAP